MPKLICLGVYFTAVEDEQDTAASLVSAGPIKEMSAKSKLESP